MKATTRRSYKERILRTLIFVQQRLDDRIEIEELSRVACFSPYHFHRVFKGMVGESLMEHLRRLRLERAAMKLRQTSRPVTEMAFDAGYESLEAFSRAFRAMFGTSPSRFRITHRRYVSTHSPSGVHYSPDSRAVEFRPIRGGSKMNVKIQTVQPMRVAFVRHVGPYDQCKPAWEKLCEWAGPRGYLGEGTRFIGLSHDDPEVTRPEKLRYDACITVDADVRPEGEIGVQEIRGGEYAVTTHVGPYNKLIETYAKLFGQGIPRLGREPASAPCLEVYLNDPESTEPDELLTDIYALLEPKA